MNEIQPLVFDKGRFVPQEKSDNFQILATLVHKNRDNRIFSSNYNIEKFSVDSKLLIANKIEEIKSFVLNGMECFYPAESFKFALIDNFPVSNFGFEKTNSILDSFWLKLSINIQMIDLASETML